MTSQDVISNALLLIQLSKSPKENYHDLLTSLENLVSEINAMNIKAVQWKSDEGIDYFEWPGFMDLAALITTGGVGAAIYNLLRIWLESRNGRRIRIKIGDVEVETTQMKKDEFLKIINEALELSSIHSQHRSSSSTFIRELTVEDFLKIYEQERANTLKRNDTRDC